MQFLRIARLVLGITQKELSERSGIPRQVINEIESGRALPKRKTMVALDEAYLHILDDRAVREICRRRALELSRRPPEDVRRDLETMRGGTPWHP